MITMWPLSTDEEQGLRQTNPATKVEADMPLVEEAIKQDLDPINEEAHKVVIT